MVRKGIEKDIAAVAAICDRIHTAEERGETAIGWVRGIYPTEDTARAAWKAGELFVMDDETGTVVAAARINQEQVSAYDEADWLNRVPPEQVMVLHTLVVDPARKGKGYGTEFAGFYEAYARANGCLCLRIDTNVKNTSARKLYKRLGYRESGVIPRRFNGIPDVNLVCLEKLLEG